VAAPTSSVRYLRDLYSVVAGLALSIAVSRLVEARGNSPALDWETTPSLLALLLTIVPFYHGSLRYLDRTYEEAGPGWARPALVLWDFAVLFVEACVLLAAAALISNPYSFAIAIASLWLLDVAWVAVGSRLLRLGNPVVWGAINVAAATLFVSAARLAEGVGLGAVGLGSSLLAISAMRTALDYWTAREFYFPPGSAPPTLTPST
jgi:hypothetical protein